MASSSGSSLFQNSGSETNLQALMDQKKRKRMISNRESARRSRMRKQKHLDDLRAQVSQLRKENHHIATSMNMATQHYLTIEADNSVIRAQIGELSHRLESLNEIINFLNANNNGSVFGAQHPFTINEASIDWLMNSWNLQYLNQPIMASADMIQY